MLIDFYESFGSAVKSLYNDILGKNKVKTLHIKNSNYFGIEADISFGLGSNKNIIAVKGYYVDDINYMSDTEAVVNIIDISNIDKNNDSDLIQTIYIDENRFSDPSSNFGTKIKITDKYLFIMATEVIYKNKITNVIFIYAKNKNGIFEEVNYILTTAINFDVNYEGDLISFVYNNKFLKVYSFDGNMSKKIKSTSLFSDDYIYLDTISFNSAGDLLSIISKSTNNQYFLLTYYVNKDTNILKLKASINIDHYRRPSNDIDKEYEMYVKMSGDGKNIMVSIPEKNLQNIDAVGIVMVYRLYHNRYIIKAILEPGINNELTYFGSSMDINYDGSSIVVYSKHRDMFYFYSLMNGKYELINKVNKILPEESITATSLFITPNHSILVTYPFCYNNNNNDNYSTGKIVYISKNYFKEEG